MHGSQQWARSGRCHRRPFGRNSHVSAQDAFDRFLSELPLQKSSGCKHVDDNLTVSHFFLRPNPVGHSGNQEVLSTRDQATPGKLIENLDRNRQLLRYLHPIKHPPHLFLAFPVSYAWHQHQIVKTQRRSDVQRTLS